ncbi:hypothetical protein CY34DRAFT_108998 [Suillus luteus UH-Slu-Lm8-n1]|uniref:Uncharacterized protein n=1 Tax=Suillus luteus UH-Slu-Lm8-n1 TaxID=930992 RepID=A0A0C9ZJN5_9AGAM|nr:hypothetical protein CY34DRAFT_108998 [Suillus luteus UH-Slu-Lm8-n1]
MAEGQGGIVKLLGVLETLRDNIKSLVRPWVVLKYQIPLHTQNTPVVKLFIEGLIRNYQYLKDPINIYTILIDLLFRHQAVKSFMKYLLFHDCQYWWYINSTKNVESLLAYSTITLSQTNLDNIKVLDCSKNNWSFLV